MIEKWRAIKGFRSYKVSNTGFVRRDGKILKTFYVSNGMSLTLSQDDEKTTKRVAHLVGAAFNRSYSANKVPVYRDGDRSNCNFLNLKWVKRSVVTKNGKEKETV